MNYIDRGSMQLSPYDQAHVALQLMLEVHSMRMQMQTERDKERELRREQTAQHAADLDAMVTRHSEASNERDQECNQLRIENRELKQQRDDQVELVGELKGILEKAATFGRGKAAKFLQRELARWK